MEGGVGGAVQIEKTAHIRVRQDTGATVRMKLAGPAGAGTQGPRIFGPHPRFQTANIVSSNWTWGPGLLSLSESVFICKMGMRIACTSSRAVSLK